MDPEPQAPPVVAVVVTCDPGPWFEEALTAIAGQDYPNLSVLVIDAASTVDPTPRVAAVAPSAFVRRLDTNRGFGASANEVLAIVEGASHYLFCHDDVAPDPDALQLLLEEAYRSNAGMVAPKLVDWHDPQRLLQVGMGADKSGAPAALVERGELDQEQHDAVRDVFVAPGGCTLIRADLFAALHGFDDAMFLFAEDLDLSWRAQVAGARVIVAPAARVRHLEALSSGQRRMAGQPVDMDELRKEVRPLQLRHRLRADLCDYGLFHLIRVVPQLLLLATVETLFGLATGHADTSRDIVDAWRWNLSHTTDIRARRRLVRENRQLPDSEVRRLQTRGSARMNAFLRGQLAIDRRLRVRGFERFEAVEASTAALRGPLALFAAAFVIVAVGSRHLLGGHIAAVGQLAPFPKGTWSGLFRPFLSGWRTTGLGAEAPAPAALALLGLGATVLLGHTGLLQQLVVLGTIPVGVVGVHRLCRPLGAPRVRLAAALVYLALPLPYNALATGHWDGLIMYAASPWVLARLIGAAAPEPFPEVGRRRLVRDAVPLALGLAVVTAFVPSAPFVFLLVAAALVVGGGLTGAGPQLVRSLAVAAVAAGIAAALLFPWTLDFVLPGATLAGLTGPFRGSGVALGFGALLRFDTGPLGQAPFGWAFPLAAAIPLVIARRWRLAWAGRLWTVAMVCWLAAWAGGRGWLHAPPPVAEVLLAPAAVAVAVCVALGLAAFESDLPGYAFGWRQGASLAAAALVVAGAWPLVGATPNGRWRQPANDFNRVLSWMPDKRTDGEFRVLWVGDPDAIPLGAWALSPGVAYGTSRDGPPDVTDRWPDSAPDSSGLLADGLRAARRRQTTELGHLLGPLAVRYVVVPTSRAPQREKAGPALVASDLVDALAAQVDLKQVESDEALLVYENVAWTPGRALLDAAGDEASRRGDARSLGGAGLAGSRPALGAVHSPTSAQGRVPDSSVMFLSETASARWRLGVDGHGVARREAFGWANAFDVDQGGIGRLTYRTSPMRYAAIVVELLFWVAAVRAVAGWRGDERKQAEQAEARV